MEVGESIESPTLGMHVTWREIGPEILAFDLHMRGEAPAIPIHVHPHQQEKITVVSGVVRSRSGDRDRELRSGEAVVTPPGEPHTIGAAHGQDAEVIAELTPALAYGEFIERSFAQDRGGHVSRKGRANPLRMATTGMADAEFFMPHAPVSLQRLLMQLFERVGRTLGYDRP